VVCNSEGLGQEGQAMTARERAMTEATDEEVARVKKLVNLSVPSIPTHDVLKLLARLERVEEELDAMKLGYRGFP